MAFASSLRVLAASWRIHISGIEVLDEMSCVGETHILAFWHRHYIELFRLFRDRPVTVVTNDSHRGRVIADICERNGMRTLQVSESGGRDVLAAIERSTPDGFGLGITVDGPLGPANAVKTVVIHLAAKLGCPTVPVSVAARRKYVVTRRWDQLEIPHLFSDVSFVIGNPIAVNPAASRNHAAEQVKRAIDAGEKLAREQFEPIAD